jgi:hypothetical protein
MSNKTIFDDSKDGFSVELLRSKDWLTLTLQLPEMTGDPTNSSYSLAIYDALGAETVPAAEKTWKMLPAALPLINNALTGWFIARSAFSNSQKEIKFPKRVLSSWGTREGGNFDYIDLDFMPQTAKQSLGMARWSGFDLHIGDRKLDNDDEALLFGGKHWIIPAVLAFRWHQAVSETVKRESSLTQARGAELVSLSESLWRPRALLA